MRTLKHLFPNHQWIGYTDCYKILEFADSEGNDSDWDSSGVKFSEAMMERKLTISPTLLSIVDDWIREAKETGVIGPSAVDPYVEATTKGIMRFLVYRLLAI